MGANPAANDTANFIERTAPDPDVPGLKYRTFAKMQPANASPPPDILDYKWEIAVENGEYYVRVVAGDPNEWENCAYLIQAEGVTVVDGAPAEEMPWVSGAAAVTVTDGKLTLTNGSGAVNNKICYVEFAVQSSAQMRLDGDFEYGAGGNSPCITEDNHYEYEWDAFYRLTKVTDKAYWDSVANTAPQWAEYRYDGLGRRVACLYGVPSGNSTDWDSFVTVYDGVLPIEERVFKPGDARHGELLRRYYYEEGNRLALAEDFTVGSPAVYIPLLDDRGTVMGVADSGGAVIEKLYYNATGLCKSFDGSGIENLRAGTSYNLGRSKYIDFGYLGMARDRFTGKYHTHFREYDPVHGRWLSEDPAGYADGLNLFHAYMDVNGTDPLGLENPIRKRANAIVDPYRKFCEARDLYDPAAGNSFEEYYREKFGDYPSYYYTQLASRAFSDKVMFDGAVWDPAQFEIVANSSATAEIPWYEEHPLLHKLQHTTLDVAGVFDPLPLQPIDSINALTYASHGEMKAAGITATAVAAGAVIGDVLKLVKFIDEGGEVGRIVDNVADLPGIVNANKVPTRTNGQLVQEIGTRAEAWATRKGLTGTPQQIGMAEHLYSKNLLNRYQRIYGDRGLLTEQSFLNGGKVSYGTPGSVRLDVIDWNTRDVWDYKFGVRGLTTTQELKIQAHGPSVTSITEVRP